MRVHTAAAADSNEIQIKLKNLIIQSLISSGAQICMAVVWRPKRQQFDLVFAVSISNFYTKRSLCVRLNQKALTV